MDATKIGKNSDISPEIKIVLDVQNDCFRRLLIDLPDTSQ